MSKPLDHNAVKQLFTEARTHHAWTSNPVADDQLRELYELVKWGPTSLNAQPARIVFITSQEGKERLYPALMGSNVEQVKSAPVTAIVAQDEGFPEHLGRLFPAVDVAPLFEKNPQMITDTAFRNSSLQGAYLMLAARSLGLDTGAMSGFDNAKVDEEFFKGTKIKSNFLCNLGYGDHSKLWPRGPRLTFEEVCSIV